MATPKVKPGGTLSKWELSGGRHDERVHSLRDSQSQLTVLAVLADGDSWAGFSVELAEGDGDCSAVSWKRRVKLLLGIEGESVRTVKEVVGGSCRTSRAVDTEGGAIITDSVNSNYCADNRYHTC